jgi:2-keto-4-pentenoate hydratase/2-oxohepta-3-ene-1,7-dioic acid hydratase in catechol pathway
MVFKIDSLIEYVSAGITIKPGDIISTGTPQGVAAFTGEPFLKDGDIVEGAIDRIGILRNPVKAESD